MADFRSRQRIQIHDGTDEFGVTTAKPITAQLSDGTDLALIDASGNLNVILAANDGVDIGDVTVNNAAGASAVNIQDGGNSITIDDGGGSITVDGTVAVTGSAIDDAAFTPATDSVTVVAGFADETTPDSVDEGDQGALRMTLDRKLLVRMVGASDGNRADVDSSGNVKAILAANDGVDIGDVTINNAAGASAVNIQDGGNSITVDAVDLDIRDLTSASDSVAVLQATHDNLNANVNLQVSDTDVSATNPVPVTIVGATSATEVIDRRTTVTVAKDASTDHDYTVTATKTLILKGIGVSASGAMRFDILTGPVAGLSTVYTGFTTGSKLNETITFPQPIEVPDTSTGTVRVTLRNDDNQAMDVFSTVFGEEV